MRPIEKKGDSRIGSQLVAMISSDEARRFAWSKLRDTPDGIMERHN